jgi:elongation factor Ts
LKKGLAKSAKRAGAIATEGVVAASVAADGKMGVLVEVNIQTDFAARNADFLKFVDGVVAAALKAKTGAELGGEAFPGGSGTVEETRAALVGKLGENISVRRWERISLDGPGKVHSYVHLGGKVGVLLGVRAGTDVAAKTELFGKFSDDTAMQVAAMSPLYLAASEVPDEAKKKQGAIFEAQLGEDPKAPPKDKWPRVIEGKLAKWLKEVCLLEQQSVLENDHSVEQVRQKLAKELGTDVVLARFVRYERGEGVEKPTGGDDFAAEVAKMAGG